MIPYVFLVSMSHSGSTLLAFMLNAHPEVFSIGETSRVHEMIPKRWQNKRDRCSCGEAFYDCQFWNSALAGMAARGYGLGDPDFFRFDEGGLGVAHEKLRVFVEAALDVTGKRLFFDAGKWACCIPPLMSNPYFDLRLINLTRDGRGVINSWRKILPDAPLEKLILRWVQREDKRSDTLKRLASSRVLDIQYEQVAQNPKAAVQRIFSFIGVRPGVDTTKRYKSEADHHIIGNKMRLSPEESIRFDEKWRTELTAEDLNIFEKMGGMAVNPHR